MASHSELWPQGSFEWGICTLVQTPEWQTLLWEKWYGLGLRKTCWYAILQILGHNYASDDLAPFGPQGISNLNIDIIAWLNIEYVFHFMIQMVCY